MLLGREPECERTEPLVARARARSGESGVLVISGEPGIGKTALLDHAASMAGVATVVRVREVESDDKRASPLGCPRRLLRRGPQPSGRACDCVCFVLYADA